MKRKRKCGLSPTQCRLVHCRFWFTNLEQHFCRRVFSVLLSLDTDRWLSTMGIIEMPEGGRVGFRCKCGMALPVPGLSLVEGESFEAGKRRLTGEDWKLTVSHLGCSLGGKQIICTPDKLILLRPTRTSARATAQLAQIRARA
jgi:hypothetical protein